MQIEHQLRQFIVKNFLFGKDTGLTTDTSLLEQGIIDSTGMLELVAFLEETFGHRIADHELIPENLDSIRNLVVFIERKQAEGLAVAG
jgi:acyl carrier protein